MAPFDEPLDYEDVRLGFIRSPIYLCGQCNKEMDEQKDRVTGCTQCGKRGWKVTFKCPECGHEISKFKQDRDDSVPCYSCS